MVELTGTVFDDLGFVHERELSVAEEIPAKRSLR